MLFKQIYEEKLSQYAYMIGCQETGEAFIIDPLRDINRYFDLAEKHGMEIVGAADTHIHADFLSGLREFAEKGVTVYASDEGDEDWKYEWLVAGNYRKKLLMDGDIVRVGNIGIRAMHTPGHTPEHLSYIITDGKVANEPLGMASGDFVFVGDVGRPDLLETAAGKKGAMKPSAQRLYRSLDRFRTLPEYLQLWPGHGAGSACGKAPGAVPASTVGYELRYNAAINAAESETRFVDFILDGQPEPPLYFARMKRDNRKGPDILGGLPNPEPVHADHLDLWLKEHKPVVIDTRPVEDYIKGHLSGSLCITLDKQFNTVAGSYVNPEDRVLLIIDERKTEEAVRDLIRVGLDHVDGYLSLAEFDRYRGDHEMETTDMRLFGGVKNAIADDKYFVVDVRKATEYAEGHIAGAMQISHVRLPEHRDGLPQDKILLVHCAAGGRAASASSWLQKQGYPVIYINDSFENCPAHLKV
ncbi:MAG TPA: MBL fold metallo-hydrolase [Balneolales bacterium]|nr:MBL fold metallo-hydrolase [Balneolales bacterium]